MWKFFKSDGSEKKTTLGPYPPRVTPTQFAALTPVDNDEVILIVDATAGVHWRLKYNAGSASAYKWEFLGGPPLVSEVQTNETTGSTTYVALTTPGPSITLPRPGDYEVRIGTDMARVSSSSTGGVMSYDIGATGAVDADMAFQSHNNAGVWSGSAERSRRKLALTAIALVAKYISYGGASASFSSRRMFVTPVRIS